MKKIVAVFLVIVICFSFISCSSKDEVATTKEYLGSAPILGVQVRFGDNVGYQAFTKDGSYIWMVEDENGKKETYEHNGTFCLDDDNLCTLTREQTDGKITLNFAGKVLSHKVYCAPKDEIDNNKIKIYDDKYLITTTSKTITFTETGEYYYVVKVNYVQGEVAYGFLLTE